MVAFIVATVLLNEFKEAKSTGPDARARGMTMLMREPVAMDAVPETPRCIHEGSALEMSAIAYQAAEIAAVVFPLPRI
jgi:hypothetical protein